VPAESAAEAESPLKSPVSTVEKGKRIRDVAFTLVRFCLLLPIAPARSESGTGSQEVGFPSVGILAKSHVGFP